MSDHQMSRPGHRPSSEQLESRILRLVGSGPPWNGDAGELTPYANLWESGMDSLASISLMVTVESEFGIEFPDEMLTRATFASVMAMAAAVESLLDNSLLMDTTP